jgi:hypothetical protein
MTRWRRVRLILAFLAGCGGLVAGLVVAVQSVRFLFRAERADGAVVELARADKGQVRPVVAYRVAGKEYRVEAGYASSTPPHGVGDGIAVLYDTGRPECGHVSPYSRLWLTPLVCLLLGGIFTLAGLSGLRPKPAAEQGAAPGG